MQQTFGFLWRGWSVAKVAGEQTIVYPLLNVANAEAVQTFMEEIRTLDATRWLVVDVAFRIHFHFLKKSQEQSSK